MRNIVFIGMLLSAAFMAGWFKIQRDGENTLIEINRSEIRNDARRAIERGREILDRDQNRNSNSNSNFDGSSQPWGPAQPTSPWPSAQPAAPWTSQPQAPSPQPASQWFRTTSLPPSSTGAYDSQNYSIPNYPPQNDPATNYPSSLYPPASYGNPPYSPASYPAR